MTYAYSKAKKKYDEQDGDEKSLQVPLGELTVFLPIKQMGR